MEAARTPETLIDIQLRTWQYIPEDCELCTVLFEYVSDFCEARIVLYKQRFTSVNIMEIK
jgi:hypothetical protein